MDLAEALGVLGLGPDASWDDIKTSYRSRLRRHHPDLTSEPNASTTTARLVEAFGVLRDATDRGAKPLPPQSEPVSNDLVSIRPIVLRTGPGDVFDRLYAAMESIGEVSYVDRTDRLVQVTVERPGTAPSHLTAEVIDRAGDTCVLFTLDPLTNGLPPDLESVIGDLTV